MKLFAVAMIAAVLSMVALSAHAHIEVRATGDVAHPGTLQLADNARLSTAALAAAPRPGAYFLGAAWLQPALVTQQVRLKAGVLYDLHTLGLQAQADGDPTLAGTAATLRAWLARLPVTGRHIPAVLDPRVVEATPAQDWPITPGDTLYYPRRPTTIRIVGAVEHACTVPFAPLADVRHYLAACPATRAADDNWVWLVQPDGHVFERGIALWNLSRQAMPLAPGAMVYVPIRARAAQRIDPAMNRQIAQFLATQPVADTKVPR